MAVNFPIIEAEALLPVAGVTLGSAEAGIRRAERKDLLVISLEAGATVSGVFTRNRFCAAPVIVCREHLAGADGAGGIRALVVNTGNANAGTGAPGMDAARRTCEAVARLEGLQPAQVLPFSTGVILEPLPVDRLVAGLPAALSDRAGAHWYRAAETIMTTDTRPKAASRQLQVDGHTVTLTGISKGAGMIRPNMATMLGFIATDASISQPVLETLVREVADRSFNAITVDGDTSTNDSFIVIASGKASLPTLTETRGATYEALREALTALAQTLSQMIVRDAEGATKFIRIDVEGGADEDECKRVAYSIAHSPLVKTAFFASDPNLGRILCAVGYAGIDDLDVERTDLYLDDVWVVKGGGRHPDYREEDGQRVMRQDEITVRVTLGRGAAKTTVWTCDFSHEYVSINADYRS